MRGDGLAVLDEEADGVGEVELALRVLRLEALERRPEALGADDVDRGVHLVDRELARATRRRPRRSRGRGRRRRGRRARRRGRRAGTKVSTVAAARSRRCVVDEVAQQLGGERGVSPVRISTSSVRPSSAARAERIASPVPRGSSWTRPRRRRRRTPRGRRARRRRRAGRRRARARRRSPSRPCAGRARGCRCFGSDGAHAGAQPCGHHGGCDRRLGHGGVDDGWGARIRTWDRGTKTRCLTAWLRPTAGASIGAARRRAKAAPPGGHQRSGRGLLALGEEEDERRDREDASTT